MLLFFDTETTGLPRNWKAPVTDINNWPRLVQIAFLLYDREGNRISEKCYIIKPDGYQIPAYAARIHGITTNRALCEGKDLRSVLEEFREAAESSKYLVAHNISFDEKIIGAGRHVVDGRKDYNVLVTILTDGEENASREYTGSAIKSLVEELKNSNWTFTYIGTDHDEEKFAVSVSITNTMMFEKSQAGMSNMFLKEAAARVRYSKSLRYKKNTVDDYYKED